MTEPNYHNFLLAFLHKGGIFKVLKPASQDWLDFSVRKEITCMSLSLEEQKAQADRFCEEVLNNHNFSIIEEFFAPEVVMHGLPQPLQGPDGYRQFLENALISFPDIHYTFEDIVVMGDKLAVRWSATATHLGTFLGIPPTGKPVKVDGMVMDKLNAEGKAVEHWQISDGLDILAQIGAFQAPAPIPATA